MANYVKSVVYIFTVGLSLMKVLNPSVQGKVSTSNYEVIYNLVFDI
jgi:hypothetical protein